jgi:hypothetical protein
MGVFQVRDRLTAVGAYAMPLYLLFSSMIIAAIAWAWTIVLHHQPVMPVGYLYIGMLIMGMILNVVGHFCGVLTVQYLIGRSERHGGT